MHRTDSYHSISTLPLGEGRLEVICGPMFSGKTEELLRRIRRSEIAKLPTVLIKPSTDTRYAIGDVVSHDKSAMPSVVVKSARDILDVLEVDSRPALVVGIDEAQFFDDALPEVCTKLANRGMRVIVAGLDLDFNGIPFGSMPELLALAEEVTKLHAVCVETGRSAHFSHKIAGSSDTVELGEKDKYIPLTRHAFVAARKK
ncbi:MAG: thymidine kinase [Crocinitomicaceae bacterium]|nr:thymidine kinase [Crocinitomicaceae bacterium]|tara:strand:- start:8663 stop:9265 length:603 start_codon:yes stop_codon:yes gene_type:complete